jgi:hypothetical protein
MADFHAAATACKHAIVRATHDNRAQAWRRWEQYCKSVGCNYIYMDGLTRQEQILMLGAFAMAVRTGRFFGEKYKTLAERTVRSTISHVVQTLWENCRPNPTKGADHELSILLSRQFCTYQNNDHQ